MKVLSLFTGIGGFDLAFERAGFEITGQCEIDKRCRELLSKHFPSTPCLEDVHDVGTTDAEIICGGFPCQDISVAGKRAGLAGERSGLWWEFARIIKQSRPRWVVVENVAGLLSSNGGRDMGSVLGTLGNLGYGWSYRVLDAQFFGVPQRRRRVFVVGHLGDAKRASQILLEPEGGNWNPPTSGIAEPTPSLSASGRLGSNPIAFHATQDPITSVIRWPTISGGATLGVLDSLGARKLMPTECERLQGFPDGWTEGFPDTTRYRMLGNAVAVPVVEWIARRLVLA